MRRAFLLPNMCVLPASSLQFTYSSTSQSRLSVYIWIFWFVGTNLQVKYLTKDVKELLWGWHKSSDQVIMSEERLIKLIHTLIRGVREDFYYLIGAVWTNEPETLSDHVRNISSGIMTCGTFKGIKSCLIKVKIKHLTMSFLKEDQRARDESNSSSLPSDISPDVSGNPNL